MKLPRGKCAATPVFAPFRGHVSVNGSWYVTGASAHDYDDRVVIATGRALTNEHANVICDKTVRAIVHLCYWMLPGITTSPDLEQYNEPKKKKRKGKKK